MNENNIVLITGASRGIGAAIASHFLSKNYIVIGTGTSQKSIDLFQENVAKGNENALGCIVDVNNDEDLNNLFKAIKERYGSSPDILVNNAGVTDDDLFIRMTPEKWENVISTNLTSVYKVTKLALRPMLKKKWGRVINISSVVAASGNPGQANYCAAKAGLIGMTKSLALEVASATRDITVNAVAPGFVQTDMTASLSDMQKEQIYSKIPMGKMGLPIDIAKTVFFLVDSPYVTGQTLHVNGGMWLGG
jgi:3-oxoacyl-[acyl-carrier protein] reductase